MIIFIKDFLIAGYKETQPDPHIDSGKLPMWTSLPAPEIAVNYWKLGQGAVMRDVILAIRADEAHHRVVNHTLGDMDLKQPNPFRFGHEAEGQ